jgi:hypothetical protein
MHPLFSPYAMFVFPIHIFHLCGGSFLARRNSRSVSEIATFSGSKNSPTIAFMAIHVATISWRSLPRRNLSPLISGIRIFLAVSSIELIHPLLQFLQTTLSPRLRASPLQDLTLRTVPSNLNIWSVCSCLDVSCDTSWRTHLGQRCSFVSFSLASQKMHLRGRGVLI